MFNHLQTPAGDTSRGLFVVKDMKRFVYLFLLLIPLPAYSDQVYLSQVQFLALAFPDAEPNNHVIWFTGERKEVGTKLLDHPPSGLRTRYWQAGQRTAWIMDEIGKEHPITIGVVIEGDRIKMVEILVYRESRGGEVRHDFFKRQFQDAHLDQYELSRNIDSISGATLSVNAVTAVARWALYLHQQLAL
ncbi:MAG: FMN-binding protein [Alcanivorax sp.]|nr:MAG: FMN-binding protein [Alcanivorax sp.]